MNLFEARLSVPTAVLDGDLSAGNGGRFRNCNILLYVPGMHGSLGSPIPGTGQSRLESLKAHRALRN